MESESLPLATLADIEAIERVPLTERLTCASTYEMLGRAARDFSPRTALIFLPTGSVDDEAVTITYGELFGRVNQAANMFADLGVRATDTVSYLLPNLPQTHYTIWGGQAAGIVNAVNPFLEVAQIAEIMNAAEARVLVAQGPAPGSDIWDKAMALRALVPGLETILQVGGPPAADGVLDFDDMLPTYPDDRLVSGRQIAPGDIAAYFHTGGTTGSPKLARHTHWGEVYQAWCVDFTGKYEAGDVFLCGLPLFHVNAVIVTGLGAFHAGTTVLLAGPMGYRNPVLIRDFWKVVEKYRVSTFSGVPTLYAALLESPVGDADISSLRVVVCGAAPMPVALFCEFERITGVGIREGYGLTEGTCVSSVNPRDGEKRIGSIGLRLPYQEMKCVRIEADGCYAGDCDTDEIGAVVIRGPNAIPGYRQEAYNEGLYVDGEWLNTGDLGRQDKDGYFWLTGRAKDLIIRGGHNIDPAVIEETLHRHADVELAAAVGKPDAYAGELPVAYVKLREGAEADAATLRDFARANITERMAAPADIFLIKTMPVTAVGKIFKPPLRHDAIRRVYGEALADLAADGTTIAVEVATDPVAGAMATITVAGVEENSRTTVENAIDNALSGFAPPHRVVWN